MFKPLQHLTCVLVVLASGSIVQAEESVPRCHVVVGRSVTTVVQTGVAYRAVESTPQYDLRRPEVISGARVTLFANFLRYEPGIVLFNLNGTSSECTLVEWRPNSVTVELPRLGVSSPKNVELQIVLPDGRIAKTFAVLLIAQPDVLIHADTVPQPTPPTPPTQPAAYATPAQGGVMLQSGCQ